MNIAKMLRKAFFIEHLRWPPLNTVIIFNTRNTLQSYIPHVLSILSSSYKLSANKYKHVSANKEVQTGAATESIL